MRDQGSKNLRPAGIALVAALPTEPPRRGDDRIHVAVASIDGLHHWSLHLAKHSCTRSSAERISDEMMFLALATMTKKTDANRFFRDSGLAFESTA